MTKHRSREGLSNRLVGVVRTKFPKARPHNIPRNIKDAFLGPQKDKWRVALTTEMNALLDNATWRLVPLPPGFKELPCMWILSIKYNADGTIERYEARLVIQGNYQEFGVDCDEVYAPVARFESLRLVLALGTILNCHIHQMDVSSAFLNGTLPDGLRIFMKQPYGYVVKGKETWVCELLKSIY